jgi:Tfp pilus assembly protein PilF
MRFTYDLVVAVSAEHVGPLRVREKTKTQSKTSLLALTITLLFLACSGANEESHQQSQRRYELAVSLFRQENQPRAALVELERAVRLDADNADAHLLIGQIYGGAAMYSRAEAPLRRAVELLRVEAEEDPSRRAAHGEARNSLAAVLINLERPAEALPILLELTRDVYYPQPHLALANLGLAYLALRQYTDAARQLERSVINRPDFCVGHYRLGEAFIRLNDDVHAIASLDRALGSNAQGCNLLQGAWRLRGEANARQHHTDEARNDFTRCRELAVDSEDGRACAAALRSVEAPAP